MPCVYIGDCHDVRDKAAIPSYIFDNGSTCQMAGPPDTLIAVFFEEKGIGECDMRQLRMLSIIRSALNQRVI